MHGYKKANYDDIINLSPPTSTKHLRMSAIDRAAQFSPFAALTGYDAAVKETARLTEQKIEIGEYQKSDLDRKFQILTDHIKEDFPVTFTYFVPDTRKEGGSYCTVVGSVKKIDHYKREITLHNEIKIPIDEVIELDSELFAITETE